MAISSTTGTYTTKTAMVNPAYYFRTYRYGTSANDLIYGNSGIDYIYGYGGDDWLYGYGGSDAIYGGGGYDRLYGGAGHDTLRGHAGSDYLSGGYGSDTYRFSAGDGSDTLYDYDTSSDGLSDIDTLRCVVRSKGALCRFQRQLEWACSESKHRYRLRGASAT